MNRLRKYGKLVALAVALILGAQVGASVLVKTRRMHGYLIAHLERSFGRSIEAGAFSVQVFPIPQIDVEGITIGEDPAFGREYFLRAEHLEASLRWRGLLRGHFEFGTMSLGKPSLILVRNEQGRWNLEGWLPPARTDANTKQTGAGPQQPVEASNFLKKIEFDEGRINFKEGTEKRPFVFTNVSGSVEQMEPGRWQLRLEAQPWRSGVALQSTGTLQVRGEVAGTSARLQPAQIRVHWEKVSLADLFRLVTGNDPGVRGEFALDGNASIGKVPTNAAAMPSEWKFEMQARAARVHRWDLTERSDNPQVNLNLKGLWKIVEGEAQADEMTIELPRSSLQGSAILKTAGGAAWSARVEKASVQAQDVLAWYRAFHPDVADGVFVEQFLVGSFRVGGWPLEWQGAEVFSAGGVLRAPGFAEPLQIGPVRGAQHGEKFVTEAVRITLGAEKGELPNNAKGEKAPLKTKAGAEPANFADLRLEDDFSTGNGSLRVGGRLDKLDNFFTLAAAFGKPLNHGWELTGGATGEMEFVWERGHVHEGRWNGSITLAKAQIEAAGLNLPLKLEDARMEWKGGRRGAVLTRADGFGATWNGTITETGADSGFDESRWNFQLHADHLDATELDRWVGPRARPNWLQRLLPSLLGNSDAGVKPSELLRRVSAEGELSADSLTIEKVKLANARAQLMFRDLRLNVTGAEAEWAGGNIRGSMKAFFSPVPQYEVTAEMDGVNLAQWPWSPSWDERWSGVSSGTIHLTTGGVGREELLKELAGRGELKLKAIEFRGWDVPSSLEAGSVHAGISRWANGEGEFTVKDRVVSFEAIELDGPRTKMALTGRLGFGQDAKFAFAKLPPGKRGAKMVQASRVFELSGPLDAPVVGVVPASAAPQRP
jgi:AsmA family